MIKTYLLTAFRHLWRNKLYAFVSVVGLALGISCAILIAMYIQDEYSYEHLHENRSRIYRVSQELEMGGVMDAAVTSMAAGPMLASEYPDIEQYLRVLASNNETTVVVGQQSFQEKAFWIVDSTFFDILSFELIRGESGNVLRKPNTIVLTETLAKKFFGEDDPMGQQLKVGNSFLTVDGIVQDSPRNTEFQFTALRPLSSIPKPTMDMFMGDWYRLVGYTYLLVNPAFDADKMEEKLAGFYDKYIVPFQEANGVSGKFAYHFQALPDLHFDNSKEYDLPRGNRSYIFIFGSVAIFILLIACINFINLSLAQSGRRSKEVGVRKTLGADNVSIRQQFLGESFIIAFIALLVGVSLVELLLPVFNNLTGKAMSLSELLSVQNLLVILGIYIVVGLMSGFYPAFVLGQLDPVRVLKGKTPNIGQHRALRRVLVVVQFVFSLAMITGTAVVFQQFSFMKGKDMGFNKEQVALISLPQDTSVTYHSLTFRNELTRIPGVEIASSSGDFPGNNVGELLFRIENNGQLTEKGIKFMAVDEHFFELYDIELKEGRNFLREMTTDPASAFIINETAAKQYGWQDEPLGKRMQWGLMANNAASNDGEVVGVVKDFNFQSLHNPIEPIVFLFNPQHSSLISFRIRPGKTDQVLNEVEKLWEDFAGIYPFNFNFVDDQFAQLYHKEEQMLTIFGYFAALSVLISILGLFALSSLTIEQRVKEIGIRKILGANVSQIILLLSKDFLVLVAIAAVIAMPLSYYFLSDWLTGFAYRVSINLILLLLVLIAAFAIAVSVIAFHGYRAARANPINALRFE